jgi:diguanylate cyclase (GGDEF)-like protein/PAS domain S-box-containing protein
MPKVLIISAFDLRADLGNTVLWRSDIERDFAPDIDRAMEVMRTQVPNLVVIDAAPPDAPGAIRRLREDPDTRPAAIAAVSRHPFLADADVLRAAGANVVIPLQADATLWDARLDELLKVPRRRDARIPVRLETWSRVSEEGDVVEGNALNISVNGLLFESPVPLEVGTKLDLRFRLPNYEGELQALGEVVRQEGRPRSGIKFLVLRGEAREAIRAFVESGASAGSRPGVSLRSSTPSSEGTEWEAALRESEALKAAMLESAPDAVLIMNHEGRIVEVNRAAERTLGYSRAQMTGKTIAETFAPPSDEHPRRRALARHLATGGGPLLGQRMEITARRGDGTDIPAEITVTRTHVKGKAFFTAQLRDITNAKRAERLQAALYRISDASAAIEDMEGLYVAIHRIVGEFMYARNFYIAIRNEAEATVSFPYFVDEADAAPPEVKEAKTLTDYVLRTGEPLLASPAVFSDMVERGEVEMVGSPSVDWLGVPLKKQGRAFGVLVVQSYDPAVRFAEADREMLTFVSHQIASALERKTAEARIEHLAYHDTLTGLPNRRLLLDRLELAVAQARRDKSQIAVLFLDLDRFKVINDSLGHTIGDEVLQGVAVRLKAQTRKGDTVARVGGDEFTVVIRNVHHPVDTAKVAELIQAALREPLMAGGREIFVTGSIGISIYPNDGTDVETLLKNSDTALHRAKEQGLDSFRLFAASMNAEAVQRLRLESELRRALARDELFVHYQPVVDLVTGEIQGMEALLRWRNAEHGLVAPSEFIPIAERTGLLSTIGPFVLKKACAQARAWQREGHRVSVAVNISPRQLHHVDLVRHVVEALDGAGLEASLLELEITESSAMQNPEATIQTLNALKSLGVRVSIDDFGMGYSSLSQLQRLPIDTLKIDRSFVRDISTDPGDAAIATAVITLAHSLKLKVVAEGVETQEQLAFLAAHDCDRVQGFLLSVPVADDRCAELLASHRPGPWQSGRRGAD